MDRTPSLTNGHKNASQIVDLNQSVEINKSKVAKHSMPDMDIYKRRNAVHDISMTALLEAFKQSG